MKLLNWIRGCDKPEAATMKEWREWQEMAKSKHPIRFWIVEEGFDHIKYFVMWPINRLYNIKYYIVNRFITKTHTLQSHLKKGEYWDLDTRMLHCMFDELVNFVEIDKAWMRVMWGDRDIKAPKWAAGWFRTRTWRSPVAGVEYLRWEQTLTNSDGTPSEQAINATELEELYVWWKHTRHSRPEPMDVSGWNEYCDIFRGFGMLERDVTEDEMKMIQHINELENQYNQEDTEMLIRLVKIRGSLWV